MVRMSRLLRLLAFFALALSACQETTIRGASGVCRFGDSLLVVGDKDGGGYFRVAIRPGNDPRLPLTPPFTRVAVSPRGVARDLEGIDVLADGRVVVLSEANCCLIAEEGSVIQYDPTLGEIAGRGLEGISVRRGEHGESLVAVVWEGGYPRMEKAARPEVVDTFPMLPLVVVLPLQPGEAAVVHDLERYPAVPLQVPVPEGDEPEAQRFRAPDLVWHRLPDRSWGFIVLLSSEDLVENPAYHHRWLQRFDLEGRQVGDPVDLEAQLPEDLLGLNWEGLAWFEEGRTLVLVHDDPGDRPSSEALFVPLPDGW